MIPFLTVNVIHFCNKVFLRIDLEVVSCKHLERFLLNTALDESSYLIVLETRYYDEACYFIFSIEFFT